MNDEQIKHMVDRFLAWKLPENFRPDGGISFKAAFNEHTQWPMKHEPTGTNLLNYTQAEAMVRHMLEGLPSDDVEGGAGLMREPTEGEISRAAWAWRNSKNRETDSSDDAYFRANWRSLPGLRALVEAAVQAADDVASVAEARG